MNNFPQALTTNPYAQHNAYMDQLSNFQQAANYQLAQLGQIYQEKPAMPDGTKPVVICRGLLEEADTVEAAQTKAEELAHQHNANAYILKPIRKVAPKRDTVSTDL